jgi:ferric-dicitrate binding protein FerR (iron transport regulator)
VKFRGTPAPETVTLPANAVLAAVGHAEPVGRQVGPWLVGLGIAVAVLGLLAWAGWLSWFGRLPGDIRVASGSTRVYLPITSMLLVSIVLSVLAALLRRR